MRLLLLLLLALSGQDTHHIRNGCATFTLCIDASCLNTARQSELHPLCSSKQHCLSLHHAIITPCLPRVGKRPRALILPWERLPALSVLFFSHHAFPGPEGVAWSLWAMAKLDYRPSASFITRLLDHADHHGHTGVWSGRVYGCVCGCVWGGGSHTAHSTSICTTCIMVMAGWVRGQRTSNFVRSHPIMNLTHFLLPSKHLQVQTGDRRHVAVQPGSAGLPALSALAEPPVYNHRRAAAGRNISGCRLESCTS